MNKAQQCTPVNPNIWKVEAEESWVHQPQLQEDSLAYMRP